MRHKRTALWGVWTALIGLLCIVATAYGAFLFANIWVNVTFPTLFKGMLKHPAHDSVLRM